MVSYWRNFTAHLIYNKFFPQISVIELCDTDSDNLIPMFSDIFSNGKVRCVPVFHPTEMTVDEFVLKPSIQTLSLEQKRRREPTLVQKMKQFTRFLRSEHASSSLKQFIVLFNLMMLKIWRNRTVLWIQLIHHLICGIFIGLYFIYDNFEIENFSFRSTVQGWFSWMRPTMDPECLIISNFVWESYLWSCTPK